MNNSFLKIGDLVSLKSHAYNEKLTSVIISGDHNSLPPIMIVSEIYKIESHSNGQSITNHHIVCIYFSSKSNLVQEFKIKDIFLKKIEYKKPEIEETNQFEIGSTVLLKSTRLELKKRKSTFSSEESLTTNSNTKNTISALLTYLPPVFHILQIKNFSREKPSKNLNESNYWHSPQKVKCIYYNSHSDRMSEVELPIDALEILTPIKEDILMEINNTINKSKFLIFQDKNDKKSIIKPQLISFRCGFYFLRAFNIISGLNIDINLSNQTKYRIIKEFIEHQSPSNALADFTEEIIFSDLVAKIKIGIEEGKYLRIKYKNKNDEISLRTLSRYNFKDIQEEGKRSLYLLGYCHLRNEERSFHVKRIQMAQVLVLPYKNEIVDGNSK